MPTIVDGVDFAHVAREWRCKWDTADDKASLAAAQALITKHLAALKALDGVKEVKRVVCGGCLDFKIITALDAGAFGAWEGAEFAPEKEFLEEAAKIEGITTVETQTYTFMSL